jgi:hypothetical protein
MTNLEEWKQSEKEKIDNIDAYVAANIIYKKERTSGKLACGYCIEENEDYCSYECAKGIRQWLEQEV